MASQHQSMNIFLFLFLTFTALISITATAAAPTDDGLPVTVRNLTEELTDFEPPGMTHVTAAGAVPHGMREIEVWLATVTPGIASPIHRHDCEEVIVVLKGRGILWVAPPSNDKYPGKPKPVYFSTNTTFNIPPNLVHQLVVDENEKEDLYVVVTVSRPPMKATIYEDWFMPHHEATLKGPFIWNGKHYSKIPHPAPAHRVPPAHEEL